MRIFREVEFVVIRQLQLFTQQADALIAIDGVLMLFKQRQLHDEVPA